MTHPADNTASADHERRLIAAAAEEASQFADSPVPLLPPIDSIPGYKIIREIGHGGMGAVYEALQEGTKRIVAVKVMLAGPFASPAAKSRFDREVELAARLQHPAIVRILESERLPSGQRYYAMDYVEGLTLDRYLAQAKPDPRAILSLFVELCEAVEHAHQQGVIHRDLKPGNVLIDREGKPHVLDFGLAKATDQADSTATLAAEVSSPGQVLGTLRYLSPEQAAARPEEVDQRTDVYALGVILFEALTGSMPYDTTGHPSTVIQRILEEPPKRPSLLSDRVDGELETIILKALEKEKARRYQSAYELSEDLGRYLRGEAVLAKPPSRFYTFRKRFWKHRRGVAAVVVALILGIVGVSGGMWRAGGAAKERRAQEVMVLRGRFLGLQKDLETGWNVEQVRSKAGELAPMCGDDVPEACLVHARSGLMSSEKETRAIAIAALEKALRSPWGWSHALLLAEFYRKEGNSKRAAEIQAEAKSDMPNTAEAWYVRSFATLHLSESLYCAERAVELEPRHMLAWRRLLELCWMTGNQEKALQALETLARVDSRSASRAMWQGEMFLRGQRPHEAIESYSAAAADPETAWDAYRKRAHAYRRLGQLEQAAADYTRAIEAASQNPKVGSDVWIRYQRAVVFWMLGRTQEALDDYRQVCPILGHPSYGDARAYVLLQDQRQPDQAAEVLEQARADIDRNPWLGKILDCLAGELPPDELIRDAQSRQNLEHRCEAYYYAGEAYRLIGDLPKARECFEQCVQTGLVYDVEVAPEPMNEYELAGWRLRQLAQVTELLSKNGLGGIARAVF